MRNLLYRLTCMLAMMVVMTAFSASLASAQQPSESLSRQTAAPQNTGTGRHEGIGVQIIGGPLFANITDAVGLDTGSKTGWLVGLAMGGNRGGRVGVEADVLYGRKGATVDGQDFDQHIIDVPVMLKVNVGSTHVNSYSIFAQGGGFFDWQFNSTLNKVDISQDTDGFEVGAVVGAGVEVMRFSVQGRYIRGLREINKTFNLGSSTAVKTQAFAVLFAFRLN